MVYITLTLRQQLKHCEMHCSTITHISLVISHAYIYYTHRTLHDATRQDNPRQENRVMCGGLRHDATRQDKKNRASSQISNIVRSLTTRPDFCLVVSRRVVDPRTLHDFLVGGCRVVSCNVRWAL